MRKLLGFSRRERLQLMPTNLAEALREFEPTLRAALPESIRIELPTTTDEPPVRLDVEALQHIVLDLAVNARDAMPRGGVLALGLDRTTLDEGYRAAHGWGTPGDYVALVVLDSGTGMDEATRSRAFEPFFTTKPPGEGSGLGLAMVYGLMKQMNGFVRLESVPGRGTRVTLFFPVDRRRPTPPSPKRAVTAEPGLILVVEDEEPVRRVARRVLERSGYQVITATNGEEALALYKERGSTIGLVVTDIVMPRMGGRELYEALRGHGATVPVLFTSGHVTRGGELEGEAGGLDPSVPFLAKPWSADELVRRVREVLGA